ncbi:MAG: hypothetical protein CL910_14855 [Deltaproteobacteria bacterium]|nr:hypothetical protein [Deltaproteobacteria bacterium]
MSAVAVLTLLCGVVALCAAAFNLLFYLLRPREDAHLWLAVAAVGAAVTALFTALLYDSQSAWDAAVLRQGILAGSTVLALGAARFTETFLGAPLGWVRTALVAGVAAMIPVSWLPSLGFTLEPVVRNVAPFAHAYIDTAIAPAHAAMGVVVFGAVALTYRHYKIHLAPDEPGRPLLLVMGFVWAACAASDVAVGASLLDAPFLQAVGCDAFAVSFTALLVRRLVASRLRVEEGAGRLSGLAEARLEEIHQRELQLVHGDRMATVGTLAAGVAHEINNPLAFVSANLNQLEEIARDPEAEKERGLFDEILDETREGLTRIAATAEGLTAMSQRESDSGCVRLERVVEAALPLARHQAHEGISVVAELADVPAVRGDAPLLGQVVLNLLVNAIHAIPAERPGGGLVTVRLYDRGDQVELEVADDGCGIPDDLRDRIFDPFFTTKEEGRGTGLGLAMSRQVVERYGGRIEAQSSSSGTRMLVTLPAARPRSRLGADLG